MHITTTEVRTPARLRSKYPQKQMPNAARPLPGPLSAPRPVPCSPSQHLHGAHDLVAKPRSRKRVRGLSYRPVIDCSMRESGAKRSRPDFTHLRHPIFFLPLRAVSSGSLGLRSYFYLTIFLRLPRNREWYCSSLELHGDLISILHTYIFQYIYSMLVNKSGMLRTSIFDYFRTHYFYDNNNSII